MQLTYNNQSLLASGMLRVGRFSGVTRMGRQVIREMNRVGMVVDMSHSGEESTLQAIELSARPISDHARESRHRGTHVAAEQVRRRPAGAGGERRDARSSRCTRTTCGASRRARCASFCAMVADTVESDG